MSIHFETVDPRGQRVICTTECWNEHILDAHPEMAGREGLVIEAINSPKPGFIYQDRDYPNRNLYYHRPGATPYYIKVIVEFNEAGNGEVITAFLADSGKSGEVMIWPRSNL